MTHAFVQLLTATHLWHRHSPVQLGALKQAGSLAGAAERPEGGWGRQAVAQASVRVDAAAKVGAASAQLLQGVQAAALLPFLCGSLGFEHSLALSSTTPLTKSWWLLARSTAAGANSAPPSPHPHTINQHAPLTRIQQHDALDQVLVITREVDRQVAAQRVAGDVSG